MEVQRPVNAAEIITLGNQVIQVGSPPASQRARIRIDGQVMHVITQDGVLWRTLPCPIPPGQRHKLQGVRLAGPEPLPPQAQTVQRKVSSRGSIQVARQRVQVGFSHAGKTVTIELGHATLRVVAWRIPSCRAPVSNFCMIGPPSSTASAMPRVTGWSADLQRRSSSGTASQRSPEQLAASCSPSPDVNPGEPTIPSP